MTFDPTQPRGADGRWTGGGTVSDIASAMSLEEHPHWNPNGLTGKYASNPAYDAGRKILEKEYTKHAKEFSKKVAEQPEVKKAIKEYTGSNFAAYREADRGDVGGVVPAEIKQRAALINSLFTKENMREATLFRGMAMNEADFDSMLKSGKFHTDAMTSMTANPDIASMFGSEFNNRDARQKVTDIKGTAEVPPIRVIVRLKDKALPIGAVSFSPNQQEMLLPKGRKYRISNVTRVGMSNFQKEKATGFGGVTTKRITQTFFIDLDNE